MANQGQVAGYDDTEYIPGSNYRVHDCERPRPPVVTPGQYGADNACLTAPSDATVLFDGKSLDKWCKGDGSPAEWKVENGYMEVVPGTGDISTKDHFGDCQLHLEWATPEVIDGDGQGRGNSGVFLMGLYEVQVLDSYENPTYADGQAGGIYGQCPPLANASRAPGEWQTYDIIWIAPRFKDGKLQSPARITVFHNGVLLHHDLELKGPTQHKKPPAYVEHAETGPLMLQDHGDLVRFRNIWYRSMGNYDEG